MAKKDFHRDSRGAAAQFFTTPNNLQPDPATASSDEKTMDTAPTTKKEDVIISKNQDVTEPVKPMKNDDNTFSIKLSKKRKRDKRISVLVNEDEYEEFSQIAEKIGYKRNDLINQLICEFVRANK